MWTEGCEQGVWTRGVVRGVWWAYRRVGGVVARHRGVGGRVHHRVEQREPASHRRGARAEGALHPPAPRERHSRANARTNEFRPGGVRRWGESVRGVCVSETPSLLRPAHYARRASHTGAHCGAPPPDVSVAHTVARPHQMTHWCTLWRAPTRCITDAHSGAPPPDVSVSRGERG